MAYALLARCNPPTYPTNPARTASLRSLRSGSQLKEIREKRFKPDKETLGFRDAANRFIERDEMKGFVSDTIKKYEKLFERMEDFGNRSGVVVPSGWDAEIQPVGNRRKQQR